MCGGTQPTIRRENQLPGLSPRVRGNPPRAGGHEAGSGSIPACAGEPDHRQHTGVTPRVYPRVCGGTERLRRRWKRWKGLSPRVRGNRGSSKPERGHLGSIPACAGEPRNISGCCPSSGVYPRVCGGTACYPLRAIEIRGLSPRVRGNLRQPGKLARQRGSIPACAGEPRRAVHGRR